MAISRAILHGSKTPVKNAIKFSDYNAAALLLNPSSFLYELQKTLPILFSHCFVTSKKAFLNHKFSLHSRS